MIGDTIASIVSIKLKRRDDGVTDQYNRVLMVKMLLLFSAIIGYNYYSDKVDCIVHNSDLSDIESFVGATCWIQGFYIYQEMRDKLDDSAYLGLPRNMDYDGIDKNGVLCSTIDRGSDNVDTCEKMHKSYYLQYQYFPFLMAAFAMFYYFPYLMFKITNTDLVSLKDYLKGDSADVDGVIGGYFDYNKNTKKGMRYRVLMNLLVKIFYVAANVVTFISINHILNGDFSNYGLEMIEWSTLLNYEQNDHSLKVRARPKPGNILLPPMGYCEIAEQSRDQRNTRINYHKFLCEISPHVLYQYVLFLLWFFLIVGILLSVVGLITALFGNMISAFCFMNARDNARNMYRKVTFREIDYLEYIRRKNMPLYNDVLNKLRVLRASNKPETI